MEQEVYDYTYSSEELIPAGSDQLHAGKVTGCKLRLKNTIAVNEKGKTVVK